MDTIVETAIAGDKVLIKKDGLFASVVKIDMIGNSIIGVPNFIDIGAVANKNYVDNGGAIIKNTDGSFTAASNIDFNGFSLKTFLIQRIIETTLIKYMWIKKYLFHHQLV